LSIAVVSLAIVGVLGRWGQTVGRSTLAAWTFIAALVTLGLGISLDRLGTPGVYAVYIWSSVLGTLVLVHLWTFLASLFTVTRARRLSGPIGRGSVLGAIAGSAVARALSHFRTPQDLLFAAAAGFLATAAIPFFFQRATAPPADGEEALPSSIADNARL